MENGSEKRKECGLINGSEYKMVLGFHVIDLCPGLNYENAMVENPNVGLIPSPPTRSGLVDY